MSKSYAISWDKYKEKCASMRKMQDAEYLDDALKYDGNDLGAVYGKDKTVFKLWAPTASGVRLNLYEKGDGGLPVETVDMTAGEKGTWFCEKSGDLNGVYYTYSVNVVCK